MKLKVNKKEKNLEAQKLLMQADDLREALIEFSEKHKCENRLKQHIQTADVLHSLVLEIVNGWHL